MTFFEGEVYHFQSILPYYDGGCYGDLIPFYFKDGEIQLLSLEEAKKFLESYYEKEVEVHPAVGKEIGCIIDWDHVPDADPWWNNRLSLWESEFDPEQQVDYTSGRQPKLKA